MELDATRCYRALTTRDRRFDGRFFAAVLSTGIYCRPVCPARTPRAENVRFFPCAAAAEEAGFRPCLRCRPETAPGTPAWAGSSAVVARALRLIGDGALDDDDLVGLAGRLGVGERQLHRLFTTHLGVAPGAIARTRRTELARGLLDETDLPVSQIALAAGFSSLRQFNHAIRARFGETPTGLRARRRRGHAPSPENGIHLRLTYRPPLDAPALLGFLAARAIPGVEQVVGDSYRRTVRVGPNAGTIALRASEEGFVSLRVSLPSLDGLPALVARARRIFDLDADPLPIAAQLQRMPALSARVARSPGLRVPGAWDPFEIAVRAVLGQQVTVRGASTLAGRLVERFGEPLATAYPDALTHLFPRAERLAEGDLAQIGIPRARAEALRGLSTAVASGALVLDAARGLEDLVARMVALPGIGAWTAHYVALRACGEPDAFPASDLGLRRALAGSGAPLSERALHAQAEAWRPWRAYAALHLWRGGSDEDAHDR
jgi:AraC family transcriptional regulator of adaptative response / DNA-3-methyladenine glycosylase II